MASMASSRTETYDGIDRCTLAETPWFERILKLW